MTFACPTCGSEYFTTVQLAPTTIRQCRGKLVREGRGHYYAGCDFRWPATRDSWYGLENRADVQEVKANG